MLAHFVPRRSLGSIVVLAATVSALSACSGGDSGGEAQGGAAPSNGGASSGGPSNGGASNGGASSGGSSASGAPNGGSSPNGSGGASAGGSSGMGTGGSTAAGMGGSSGTGGTNGVGGKAAGGVNGMGGKANGNGGTEATGGKSSGGASSGGATNGGSKASGGNAGTAGNGGTGGGTANCPFTGHVTYTLSKSANPTQEEQNAYTLITKAMDKAISYYNCYTDITKSITASYVPSVATADGNSNGSMRFGSDTTYMDYRTAMHEISHTVGIGTASNWGSFLSNGLFTGTNADMQLKAINATLTTPLYTELHADTQHFWPYGINYQSEVKSEEDLLNHCKMVMAIRKDLGLK